MKIFLLIIILFYSVILNAQPGELDSSFGTNGTILNYNLRCDAVALQQSGKIVTCGTGLNNNITGLDISSYNAKGSIDSSFGTNGYSILDYNTYGVGEFFCLTISDDDKIIAAGNINDNIELAKFTADGKLDSSFGNNGVVQTNFGQLENAFAIKIQTDGKIVVAGQSSPDLVTTSGLVVRYLSDGKLDLSFGDEGKMLLSEALKLFSLAIQTDGKIVVGGVANIGDNEFYIGRLNENGSYDKGFGNKGYVYTRFSKNHRDELHSLAIQPDGKILGAGISNINFADQDMGVARYCTDGSLDSSFGTGGLQSITVPNNAAEATAVLLQKDGKIILSGDVFNNDPTSGDAMIVRLNMNGGIDSSFGENGISITDISKGSDVEKGAVLQTDGKIVTVGESFFKNNNYGNLARYNNNDESKKQIIITKIKRWIQHHNGIEWDGNNNINNYVVQRSYNGIHFNSIARINTNNNSSLTYEDPSPLSGTNYYRLQTTSVNGAVNYSNIVAISYQPLAISLSPNPATNSLHIEGLSSTQKTKLTVVDFAGNVKLQAVANNTSFNLNIASLTTGNYLLKIETKDEVVTKKFVKE